MKRGYLSGIHAVNEALRSGRTLDHVIVARGSKNPRLQQIIDECRRARVTVRFEGRETLNRLAESRNHQGVVAAAAAKAYAQLKDILESLDHAGLIVVLDGIEDPRNLGAVIRSAHAAGADAVVIPERRAAHLTEAVGKASAGALEYLPVARTKNLSRALEQLKSAGFWIYGLDQQGRQSYDQADYRTNTALVLGGEGKGLHRLTAERCDVRVKIPVVGKIASLNVSVAAGIVLFEAAKQRRASPQGGLG